jgi:hypothetical protein
MESNFNNEAIVFHEMLLRYFDDTAMEKIYSYY